MKKIKLFIFFAVIFFIGNYLFQNIQIIKSLLEVKSNFLLISSFVILIITFIIQVKVWKKIFWLNNIFLSYIQSLHLYSTAVLTAYIPGKLPGLFITAKYAGNLVESEGNSFISILMYQFMSLLSAFTVGSCFLVFSIKIKFILVKILICFLIILSSILTINPNNYFYLKKLLKKIFKKEIKYKNKANYIKSIIVFFQFSFIWILISFSICLLNSSIKGNLEFNDFIVFTPIFLFSQILGSIVFILPSGIGVFESAIYYGIQTFISIEDAIRLSAISRIFMIVPAFLVFFSDSSLFLYKRLFIKKNIRM